MTDEEKAERRRQQLREAGRRYRLAHPDKCRERQNAWRKANPEKSEARRARYLAKHGERVAKDKNARRRRNRLAAPGVEAAYQREYRQRNLEHLRAKARERHAKNPEYQRTRSNQYRKDHPEKVKANQQAWRLANLDRCKAKIAAWRAANPDAVRLNHARRRARLKGAPVSDLTAAQWKAIQEAADHCCAYCGKRRKGKLTQDHITPLSKGGNHTASNVVPACGPCNSTKHTGPPLRPVQPLLLA